MILGYPQHLHLIPACRPWGFGRRETAWWMLVVGIPTPLKNSQLGL